MVTVFHYLLLRCQAILEKHCPWTSPIESTNFVTWHNRFGSHLCCRSFKAHKAYDNKYGWRIGPLHKTPSWKKGCLYFPWRKFENHASTRMLEICGTKERYDFCTKQKPQVIQYHVLTNSIYIYIYVFLYKCSLYIYKCILIYNPLVYWNYVCKKHVKYYIYILNIPNFEFEHWNAPQVANGQQSRKGHSKDLNGCKFTFQ